VAVAGLLGSGLVCLLADSTFQELGWLVWGTPVFRVCWHSASLSETPQSLFTRCLPVLCPFEKLLRVVSFCSCPGPALVWVPLCGPLTLSAWIFDHAVLFLAGVFAHLEMLEARAYEAAVKQEETEQREEKLARLKARVQELRRQRDELRAKVDLQQKGVRKGLVRRAGGERWCAPALGGWVY